MISEKVQYTVSELNFNLKNILESSFEKVSVTGEISNFHHHPSSGHMYFTLKDSGGELRSVMFSNYNMSLNFKPTDGIEVVVSGSVTFYEKKGQAQLIISKMKTSGEGNLFKSFIELKNSLSKKGMFDSSHKKPIPQFPNTIGLVTSDSGAAIKDILIVLSRRAAHIKIVIKPVVVQGEKASRDISQAIEDFNKFKLVDVIIISRGGGSIEDLWAFNEELLAKTIFESSIPIISAVGHETDFTISDFISDLRAPTPSAAAEIVSASSERIISVIDNYNFKIINFINKFLEKFSLNLDYLENRFSIQNPEKKILLQGEKLNDLKNNLINRIKYRLDNLDNKQLFCYKQLVALGPDNVLGRGYSIAFSKDGKVIQDPDEINIQENFLLKMKKGSLMAKKIIKKLNNEE